MGKHTIMKFNRVHCNPVKLKGLRQTGKVLGAPNILFYIIIPIYKK
jgi:hypothetical protein